MENGYWEVEELVQMRREEREKVFCFLKENRKVKCRAFISRESEELKGGERNGKKKELR